MVNLVPRDIRNIFPTLKAPPLPEELIDRVQIDQYLEKTEEIYRLNIISEDMALDDLSYILKLEDPNLKGIAWASLGGIHTFNGNYRKAFTAFNMALDQSVTEDVKAFIFTELSNLFRKLGYKKESLSILESALNGTKNEKLIWRIKTYIGLCYKYIDPGEALTIFRTSVVHYRQTGDYVRLGNVLRHIGLTYIHTKEFDAAAGYFDEAMQIAVGQKLIGIRYSIQNDKGWLLIRKEEYEAARSLYAELLGNDLTAYLRSLVLQNLAYLEFECLHYREAITYQSQSLQITTRYEMRDMAFEDYYKLGLCHEKLGAYGLAEHFYSLGYGELRKELDLGLRVMGYRKKLLDSYINFLRNNQQVPPVDIKDQVFGFAMDHTLKEIRETFHKSLLSLHMDRTKTAPELCKGLNIDTRTYFGYQKKLGLKRGAVEAGLRNTYFKQYLDSLAFLSWKEANRRFEADLFNYLLLKYQHNKKKLADTLQVSYQQVLLKTR